MEPITRVITDLVYNRSVYTTEDIMVCHDTKYSEVHEPTEAGH